MTDKYKRWELLETDEFVERWIQAFKENETLSDLAQEWGTTMSRISSRASYLRKIGIPLPRLYQGLTNRKNYLKKLNDTLDEELRKL